MQGLLKESIAGKIDPTLEILDFHEVPNVFDRLLKNTITGRVVIKIP